MNIELMIVPNKENIISDIVTQIEFTQLQIQQLTQFFWHPVSIINI